MKTIAISLLACALAGAAHGADLFESNKLLPIKQGDVVAPEATIGGYAIYPGDSGWKFEQGKSEFVIGASLIWMGHLVLVHRQGSQLVAWQNISANLSRSLAVEFDPHFAPVAEQLLRAQDALGLINSLLLIDLLAIHFSLHEARNC